MAEASDEQNGNELALAILVHKLNYNNIVSVECSNVFYYCMKQLAEHCGTNVEYQLGSILVGRWKRF